MTHDIDSVDNYVAGDRRVVLVDVDITSLDRDGEEDLDFADETSITRPLQRTMVGRDSGATQANLRWEFDNKIVRAVRFNGNDVTAGTNMGVFRLRVEGDR